MQKYRPRRSLLYIPASNIKALDKANSLNADCLIFDLEDAVAPAQKQEALENIANIINGTSFEKHEIIIRTNAQNSLWFNEDIDCTISAKPDAVLIPKISNAQQIKEIDELIRAKNNNQSIDIWAMIETPMAIIEIAEICKTAQTLPLRGLVVGTNDLAKETGAALDLARVPFHYALSAIVIAARAYGVLAFDGVYNNISDLDGLEVQTKQAKHFGFDGKTIIHPSQIDICNQIFAPSHKEIEFAKKIIAAFEDEENLKKGVIKLDGQMVELLHLEMAKQTIHISNMIQ